MKIYEKNEKTKKQMSQKGYKIVKLWEMNFPSQKPKNPFSLPKNIKKAHKKKLKMFEISKIKKNKKTKTENPPTRRRVREVLSRLRSISISTSRTIKAKTIT